MKRNHRPLGVVSWTMKHAAVAAFAALVLAACASPAPTPITTTPIPTPSLVSPSPTPGAARIACSTGGPNVVPGGCPAEEQAVLAAVAPLGYPVKAIEISPRGFPCGVPFPQGTATPAPGCPMAPDGPTAYVMFYGTEKEAGLLIRAKGGSVVAIVLAFGVPGSGPAPA